MIFGRKKKVRNESAVEADEVPVEDDETDDALADAVERADEWDELDASRDWREDGPFDIDEVDLEADDVERLDFGCLVITPFPDMNLQMQLDQKTGAVHALLVSSGESAIEVALFAAPAHSTIVRDTRQEMVAGAAKVGGEAQFAEGPFGTETRRIVPVKSQDGKQLYHISRTWLVEGPKWMLRGVVMGKAAQAEGKDGITELLYEFFANIVVRRDDEPHVPGSRLFMRMPPEMQRQAAEHGLNIGE